MKDPATVDVHRCLDDADRIGIDLPCAGCGYNLRARELDGACPECGAAIRRTVWSGHLMFEDGRTLRRLRRGLTTLLVGTLASIVGGGLMRVFTHLFFPWSGTVLGSLEGLAVVQLVLLTAPALIQLIGVWRLTARSGGTRSTGWRMTARWALTLTWLVGAAEVMIVIWWSLGRYLMTALNVGNLSVTVFLSVLAGMMQLVGVFSLGVVGCRLASRAGGGRRLRAEIMVVVGSFAGALGVMAIGAIAIVMYYECFWDVSVGRPTTNHWLWQTGIITGWIGWAMLIASKVFACMVLIRGRAVIKRVQRLQFTMVVTA